VVIEQDQVLTAAHCLFNRRTGRFLPPSSLHFLLGYQRGEYKAHALVGGYTIGPGGVSLRHPASGITLGQIYKAVESESRVFAMRSQVHEGCVVACAMKRRLGPIFNAANDAVEQALSKTSLAELVRGIG
jgi:hypothetical protein